MTCDIILGAKPSDSVCAARKAGSAETTDGDGNTIPAVPGDASLTGKAGRKRRSIKARSAEYQESTG